MECNNKPKFNTSVIVMNAVTMPNLTSAYHAGEELATPLSLPQSPLVPQSLLCSILPLLVMHEGNMQSHLPMLIKVAITKALLSPPFLPHFPLLSSPFSPPLCGLQWTCPPTSRLPCDIQVRLTYIMVRRRRKEGEGLEGEKCGEKFGKNIRLRNRDDEWKRLT